MKSDSKESYNDVLNRLADNYDSNKKILLKNISILSNSKLLRDIADSMEYYQKVMSN